MTKKALFCATVALPLASCTQMNHLKEVTSGGLSKVTDASKSSFAKLMPARVPIVEVREKDLEEMPSGQEQALAFEKSRRNRFWFFGGPVDFKEPQLPDDTGALDGDLLPPKVE